MFKTTIKPDWRKEALENHLNDNVEWKYERYDASSIQLDGIDSNILEFECLLMKNEAGQFQHTGGAFLLELFYLEVLNI